MSNNAGYNFFNLPRKYGIKDYNYCIERIVKKYFGAKGLVSIYEWGSVSNPGISDIDIVFVFNAEARPLSFQKRSFRFNNSSTRYLTRHPFVFITQSSLEKIRYVNHGVKLRLLHGKKFKVKNLSTKDLFYVKAAIMNDLSIRHYPRDFIIQYSRKSINVRDTLLRLNSLRYTIDTMKKLTGKNNREWAALAAGIEQIRDNWFNNENFTKLAELNEKAVLATLDVVRTFREFLLDNSLVKIGSGEKVEYYGAKNKALFVKDWKIKTALTSVKANAKKGKFYSVLPLELAPQLAEYSMNEGPISRYIKANLSGNLEYKLKNPEIIKKRIAILNEQALLAARLRHSDFPAFFDFGYRSRAGINNWILRALDMIKY